MSKRILCLLLCLLLSAGSLNVVSAASSADFTRLHMEEAWKYSTGKGVNAAVIDCGADLNDPGIKSNIKGVYNAVKGSTNRADVQTSKTHGTACAKTLVSAAPDVNLYIINVWKGNSAADRDIRKGIQWAKAQKCRVISISFGTEGKSGYEDLINEYYDAPSDSTLICASGGNEGRYEYHYPASFEHTLSVAAAEYNAGQKKYMPLARGTYNDKMDVAAPGGSSSSAAAFAAGTAALMFQADPSMTARQCHALLKNTALDLGPKGRDHYSGYGLLQPYKALKKILNIKPAPKPNKTQHTKSLKISKKKVIISIGESRKLTCRRLPSGSKDKISWSSKRPSIVIVDSAGRLKARNVGTATVTARTSRGVKASCKVIVCPSYVKNGWLQNSKNGKILHNQLLITWKKVKKSDGYEIQIATDKKFSRNVLKKAVRSRKTTSCRFTRLKKGRGYYLRMRTYKTVGNSTYYSAWVSTSSVVYVK